MNSISSDSDGVLRNAELSSAVVKNPNGTVITVGQILDITERKQAEVRPFASPR